MNSLTKANKAKVKADKGQALIAGIEEIQSIRVDRIKTEAAFESLAMLIESVTIDYENSG